jgi:hypothetical protein
MICDALWWLPTKMVRHFFRPVLDMLESMAEASMDIEEHIKEQAKAQGL